MLEVIREMRLLRRIDLDGRKSPLYTPRTKLQKQVVKPKFPTLSYIIPRVR